MAQGVAGSEGEDSKTLVQVLGEVPAQALPAAGWTIAPPAILWRLKEIERCGRPLGQIAEIHVGIRTLADELYIFQHPKWRGDRVEIQLRDGRRLWLEAELLRPSSKSLCSKAPTKIKIDSSFSPTSSGKTAISSSPKTA